jgi:hypothetical protein
MGVLESGGVVEELLKGSKVFIHIRHRAAMLGQGVEYVTKSLVDVVDRALEEDAEAESVVSEAGTILPNKGKDG